MADLHNRRNEPVHSADNPALTGMTALERDEAIANARRGVTTPAKVDAYLNRDKDPHS